MKTHFRVGLFGSDSISRIPILYIGVGKTSIVLRLVDNYFSRSFKPSNGVFRVDYPLYAVEMFAYCRDLHSRKIVLNVNDFSGLLLFLLVIFRKSFR